MSNRIELDNSPPMGVKEAALVVLEEAGAPSLRAKEVKETAGSTMQRTTTVAIEWRRAETRRKEARECG